MSRTDRTHTHTHTVQTLYLSNDEDRPLFTNAKSSGIDSLVRVARSAGHKIRCVYNRHELRGNGTRYRRPTLYVNTFGRPVDWHDTLPNNKAPERPAPDSHRTHSTLRPRGRLGAKHSRNGHAARLRTVGETILQQQL
jgi:hypothetical protein